MAVASPVDIEMHRVQSRVHERLFGAVARSVAIGRFTVLGPLGQGGMGVVFAAHDPELDRKVAIKLVAVSRNGSSSSSQSRLLVEAQTLARLSHPNIVAVHEVGTHEGGVFVAMECIDGETLEQWLARAQPSWSQIVDVFAQAGQGLAAAHREGVVHRDFKPSNVMIDRTGRVRVLDFGLAIDQDRGGDPRATQSSQGGSASTMGGTPLYMAPEQLAGAPASIRSDQYAFCVSLASALTGHDVPGWLRRVLQRGLGPATSRWPAMETLLDALARGRARARRRKVLVGVVAVAMVAAGVFALVEIDHRRRTAACTAAGAIIEDVWNGDARASTREALLASGKDYAAVMADKVLPRLDDYADAWRVARTEACLASELHGSLDADTSDRALWCLDGQRTELDVFVRGLTTGQRLAQNAVVTAAGLQRPDSCLDVDRLRRLPAPPTAQRDDVRAVQLDLARADAIARAGDYDEALAVVRAAQTRASGLEWPPLHAAVKRREGSVLERQGAYAEAELAGREAFFAAARVGAWETASAAAIDLVYVVGTRRSRHEDALEWVRHAEVVDAHAGDPLGLRAARRLSIEANVRVAMADYPAARAQMEQSLAILEAAHGPDHPIVATALGNLATLLEETGELQRARELNERVLAIRQDVLGPDHPDVAGTLNNLASTLHSSGDLAGAAAAHTRALEIRERAFGPDHPVVAKSLSTLAAVLLDAGEPTRARELQTRALAVMEAAVGADHPDVGIVLHNLGTLQLATGDHAGARTSFERALAIHEKAGRSTHPTYAQALASLADVDLAEHAAGRAREELERALAIYGEHEGDQEGELAARFSLAEAIVATGGDRARARVEAEAARAGFRSMGAGQSETVAAIDAWLAEHGADP